MRMLHVCAAVALLGGLITVSAQGQGSPSSDRSTYGSLL